MDGGIPGKRESRRTQRAGGLAFGYGVQLRCVWLRVSQTLVSYQYGKPLTQTVRLLSCKRRVMAHTCIECGSYCTCHGDIDDIDFGEVDFCTHCPVDGSGDEECFFSGTDNMFCSKCGCDSFESPIHFVNNSWLCENCTKPNTACTGQEPSSVSIK